jgi:hypothetical protein
MAKYAKSAGGNWSAAATWSATSSAGVDNAGAPAATDDVIFDAGAISVVTVDTTTCLAKTLTCQALTNNIAFTAAKTLTVSSNVTFYAGMTLSGTGTLALSPASGSVSLTSGGVTFPGILIINGSVTYTLVDSWTVTGLFSHTSGSSIINKTSAETITCNGGMNLNSNCSGTATLVLGGGTWTGNSSSVISINIIINGTTAITISNQVSIGAATLTYTAAAGGITVTGADLCITGNATLNTNGLTWEDILLVNGSTNVTLALTSPLQCSGAFGALTKNTSVTTPTTMTMSGAYNISCGTLLLIPFYTLKIVPGITITVSTRISMSGDTSGRFPAILQSVTASSAFTLTYQGARADCGMFAVICTDVDASTSAQALENWCGGTLTRCTNITNRTVSAIGGGGVNMPRTRIGH